MTHLSRKDPGLVAVYSLASLVMLLLAVYTVFREQTVWSLLLAIANLAIGYVPFSIVFPGVRYDITADELVVRGGMLFRWRVLLKDIERVQPVSGPVFVPGRNVDQLRIDFRVKGRKRHMVVMPASPTWFMRDLAASCPGLLFEEDSLLRIRVPEEVLV